MISYVKHVKAHEIDVKQILKSGEVSERQLRFHRIQIENLQNERIAHLHVMLTILVCSLLSFGLVALFKENSIVLFLPLLFLILFIPYVFHYFFLENSVQRWYVLEKELYRLK